MTIFWPVMLDNQRMKKNGFFSPFVYLLQLKLGIEWVKKFETEPRPITISKGTMPLLELT